MTYRLINRSGRVGLSLRSHSLAGDIKVARASQSGFTFLEMLLVLAIFAILAAVSIPVYENLQLGTDLDTTAVQLAVTIRRAELKARAVDADSPWGVELVPGSIVLFRGSDYANRQSNFDEVTTLPNTITVSGLTEIDFAKFTALPAMVGSIQLASPAGTKMITLNSQGMVDIQ